MVTEIVNVTAIFEFVKLVVIIYLDKEGHLADYNSLIFGLDYSVWKYFVMALL